MSHAPGEVWRANDPLVYHFEYNGTSDVIRPAIWRTHDEMRQHWREGDGGFSRFQACESMQHQPEPVIIYSHYGGESWWHGTACFECWVIRHPISPFDDVADEDDHQGAPTEEARLVLAMRAGQEGDNRG